MGCVSSAPSAVVETKPPSKSVNSVVTNQPSSGSRESKSIELVAPLETVEQSKAPVAQPKSQQEITTNIESENLVSKVLEPVFCGHSPEKKDQNPSASSKQVVSTDDELLLDFEMFLMLPKVAQIIENKLATVDTIHQLFMLEDGNGDGFLDDSERESLLTLLLASYPTKTDANLTESELPLAISSVTAPSSLPSGPKSRQNRSKPKVAKFSVPDLAIDQAEAQNASPIASPLTNSASVTPGSVGSTWSKDKVSSVSVDSAFDVEGAPERKRGFVVTKRGGDTSGTSRFFTLDCGKLSYMDSTSRTPPFSMIHREVTLCGTHVNRQVRNVVVLTPNSSVNVEDSIVLEFKSEGECDDWLSAIGEHIDFFGKLPPVPNSQ